MTAATEEALAVRYYDWIAHYGRRTPDKIAAHRSRQRTPLHLCAIRRAHLAAGRVICATRSKVARGDRVAVLALNTTDTLEVQFACGRLGAVFLPLNTRLTVPELQFIVGDAAPKVMIHDADLAETALTVAKLCNVSATLLLGPSGSYEAGDRGAKPIDTAEHVTLDDISTIMYTSGTTGQPKGAIITHGMTFWNCVNLGGPAYISPSSVLLTVLPLFHTGGLNCYTNPVLHAGGTVLIMRAFDPGVALQLISDPARGINVFFGVPSIYQFMAQHPAFATSDFSRLVDRRCRRRADAGAAVEGVGGARRRAAAGLRHDRDLAGGAGARPRGRRAQGRLVRQAGAAHGSADRPPRRHAMPMSANSASSGSRDRTSRRVTGTGRTPTSPPSPTAGCTPAMPRAIDEEGFYYIVDRWKDMYISGGENVYPAEVESVLHQLAAIAEAAIIGIPNEQWGEVGMAIVAVKPGHTLTPAEIHAHCAANLARFKCPRLIEFVDALPRNATGKIHKPTLRKNFSVPSATDLAPAKTS